MLFIAKVVCVFAVGVDDDVDVLVVVLVAFDVSNASTGGVDRDVTFDVGALDFIDRVVGITDDSINLNVAGNDTVVVGRVGFTVNVESAFVVGVDDIPDALDVIVVFVVGNVVTGYVDAVLMLDFVDDIVGVMVDLCDGNVENNDAVVVARVGFTVNVFRAFVDGPYDLVDVRVVVVAFVSGNVALLEVAGTVTVVLGTLDFVDDLLGVNVVFVNVKVAVDDMDVAV